MWNIIFGLAMIIGGATDQLVLIGTNSSGALIVIGSGLCIWGLIQVSRTDNQAPQRTEHRGIRPVSHRGIRPVSQVETE